MDLSILEKTDLDSLIAVQCINAARAHRSFQAQPNLILLRAFKGATRQEEAFTRALSEAQWELKAENITLIYEVLDGDSVKNVLKWTVAQLVDWLLEADIHMIPCHVHEGNLAKTESWNVDNIRAQLKRLKYHKGVPMGKHIDCCIWGQDKYEMYMKTYPLSAPTMKIPLEPIILSSERLEEDIRSFMDRVRADSVYYNDDQYILKLPFSCGGQHKGKKITIKTAKGFSQILKRIQEWLNNEDVMGYIPFAILQPRIKDNTEAKVVCFNGKMVCRNPHKDGSGSGRRSTLGSNDNVLGAVAEDMIAQFKAVHPELIADQVLRVDFFRDSQSGRYILNEIESFNAMVVGIHSGDAAGSVMMKAKLYWKKNILELARYHMLSI